MEKTVLLSEKLELLKAYRIGIFGGGPSSEREVSLKSARAVNDALGKAGLDIISIDIAEEANFKQVLDDVAIDLAFIALHGRFGEDGRIQEIFSEKNIPYTGSDPEASSLAMDKLFSKKAFEKDGILTPPYFAAGSLNALKENAMSFPCVVKPRYEGSSIGLSVVRSKNDIEGALELALKFGEDALIEEYIPGRELTVGILGDEALPIVEIVAAEGVYDFNAKYKAKDTKYIVPAEVDGKIYKKAQMVAVKAHKALGCKCFSRVDLRLSEEGELFVLEVNTIPGLTERSLLPMAAKAKGVDFLSLCVEMLVNAIA